MQMHATQLTVSPETVRTLVDQQIPEWRSLPVSRIAASLPRSGGTSVRL